MISYAQNLEDVLVARFFDGDTPQTYVDVGAAHPSFHSVTKHFYDSGWQGLNIEPRKHLWELLKSERPRDWNLQLGVSDSPGTLPFFEVTSPTVAGPDAGGLSTFDVKKAAEFDSQGFIVSESQLLLRPLSDLLSELGIQDVGFLKIDVEGFEYRVIKSLDWEKWRPRLIVAECTVPLTKVVCDDDVRAYLQARNYLPVHFDGLNRYFVREEDSARASRLTVPANVTDGYLLAEEVKLRSMAHDLSVRNEELCNALLNADAAQATLQKSVDLLREELANLTVSRQQLAKGPRWWGAARRYLGRVRRWVGSIVTRRRKTHSG